MKANDALTSAARWLREKVRRYLLLADQLDSIAGTEPREEAPGGPVLNRTPATAHQGEVQALGKGGYRVLDVKVPSTTEGYEAVKHRLGLAEPQQTSEE